MKTCPCVMTSVLFGSVFFHKSTVSASTLACANPIEVPIERSWHLIQARCSFGTMERMLPPYSGQIRNRPPKALGDFCKSDPATRTTQSLLMW